MATAINQAVAVAKPTKMDAFRGELLGGGRLVEIKRALPKHIPFERFERNLLNALMQNADLLDTPPALVFREVAKAAGLGLLLDPHLGEAWIIKQWNGRANRYDPALRIGYRGIIKLARQSGEIASVYAHEVCQNDEIECVLGDSKKLIHKPNLFADRGEVVGYYAVVKYANGETDFEPMTKAQVERIRDRSDAWRAFSAGKIKSTPWSTDPEEMGKKTVLRRLLKRVPQSPDLASALQTDADAEEPATEPLPAPMSRLDAIIADPEPDQPAPDPTTGEIIDTKPAPDADSPAAKEAASGAAGADNASADPAGNAETGVEPPDWLEYEERICAELQAAAERGLVTKVLTREAQRLTDAPADVAKRVREHAVRVQQPKAKRT